LIGLSIAAAVIMLIGFTRFGILITYKQGLLQISLKAGFLRINILPQKKRRRKKRVPGKNDREKGGSLFLLHRKELGKALFASPTVVRGTLRYACRCVRIDRAEFRIKIAGRDNPAGAAVFYGGIMAVLGVAVRLGDKYLRIKRKKIIISPDFQLGKTYQEVHFEASISAGRGLYMSLALLLILLKNAKQAAGKSRQHKGRPLKADY